MKTRLIATVTALAATAFSVNAQIRVISNQNVGVGIDTPAEKLHINGSVRGNQNAGALQIKTTQGYVNIGPQNTSCVHYYSSLPANTYHYFDKGLMSGDGKFVGGSNQDLTLYTGYANSYTTRMTISYSSGNVGIGRPPHSTYKLDVAGDIAVNGVNISSDSRLKENIKPIEKTTDKVALLQPISFTYSRTALNDEKKTVVDSAGVEKIIETNTQSFYDQKRYGFSAQELQKVFPDLVTTDEDGYLGVDYIGLIPVLVEAIKEQQTKISELETKVAKLSTTKPK